MLVTTDVTICHLSRTNQNGKLYQHKLIHRYLCEDAKLKLLGGFGNMLEYVEKCKIIPYLVFYQIYDQGGKDGDMQGNRDSQQDTFTQDLEGTIEEVKHNEDTKFNKVIQDKEPIDNKTEGRHTQGQKIREEVKLQNNQSLSKDQPQYFESKHNESNFKQDSEHKVMKVKFTLICI